MLDLLFCQVTGSIIELQKFRQKFIEVLIGNKMPYPGNKISPQESILY